MEIGISQSVILFTLILTVFTSFLFGLLPALQSSKTDLVPALKGETTRRTRSRSLSWRDALVVAQIAITLVLLTGGGLILRSFLKGRGADLGFQPANVLLLDLSHSRRLSGPEQKAFYAGLVGVLEHSPGVRHASLASRSPLAWPCCSMMARTIMIPDSPVVPSQQELRIKYNSIGPAYFRTLGMRLVRGREFTDADDDANRKVAIISERMARQFWSNQNPLGKSLRTKGSPGAELEIVGIVRDSRINDVKEEPEPYLYVPFYQGIPGDHTLLVETAAGARGMADPIRRQLRNYEKSLVAGEVTTMDDLVRGNLMVYELSSKTVVLTGSIALLLAAVGLFGVISYLMSRRTREIGIRMALGAQRGDVLREVLSHGMKLGGIGLGVGLILSGIAARLLSGFLFGVAPFDPLTFVAACGLVMAASLAASYLPARRATRVDPLVALRYE